MRGPVQTILAAAVLAAAAQGAYAEPVRIRSGDHPGFSRLVLYVEAPAEPRFGRVEGGYELRLPGAPDFDTSEVFVFITRDRVAELGTPGDGRLALKLGCECHASLFAIPQGLVIDVIDGPAPDGTAFESALDGDGGTAEPSDRGAPANRPVLPTLPLARSTPALPPLPGQPDIAEVETAGAEPHTDPAAEPLADGTEADLNALRIALLRQLGRAASQGVIEVRPPQVEPAAGEPARHGGDDPPPAPGALPDGGHGEAHDDGPPDPVEAGPDRSRDPAADTNIRIQTVFDRDFGTGSAPPAVTSDGMRCLDPALVDVVSWGADPALGAELARGAGALVDARDRPARDAIIGRARYLVFLGFGAEAMALLDEFETDGPQPAVLREMARIVDLDRRHLAGIFAGQASCPSKVALWALLARDGPGGEARANADAVVAAIAELPLHLRRHLGPEAAERFREVGDASTAALIRNAIRRAPGDPGAATRMLEAKIALEDGDRAGEVELEALAHGNDRRSAEALVLLIDTRIDGGRTVPAALFRDAEARALEYRGTPIGRELNRARLAALIASGRLAEALDALLDGKARSEDLDPAVRQRLLLAAVDAAARAPQVAELLPRLLRAEADPGAGPEADAARRALAGRLLDLGLPGQATRIMDRRLAVPARRDRLLLARARLMQGESAGALMLLAGLEGAEVEELRGRALMLGGDAAAAADAFVAAGDEAAARGAAWIARDAARIGALGDQLQRALGAAAAGPDPGAGDRAAGRETLETARALAERSRTARDLIESLLAGGSG